MGDKPYRDGAVHVLSEQCSTCVGRPGNLMELKSGRLQEIVRDNVEKNAALQCHQTLSYGDHPKAGGAVCRWFFDTYDTLPLRLARMLELVVFDDPPS